MEVFINLVDGGANPKAFKKLLGMKQEEIAGQMVKISLYREIVKYTAEIKTLSKNRNENMALINEKRKELLTIIAEWNSE